VCRNTGHYFYVFVLKGVMKKTGSLSMPNWQIRKGLEGTLRQMPELRDDRDDANENECAGDD
jgi:hypothetical protein